MVNITINHRTMRSLCGPGERTSQLPETLDVGPDAIMVETLECLSLGRSNCIFNYMWESLVWGHFKSVYVTRKGCSIIDICCFGSI